MVLLFVLGDLSISILILRVKVFEYFLDFILLSDFKLPHLIVFLHILHQAFDNKAAILVVTSIYINVCSLGDFLKENVSSYGHDKTQAEVWVEFLLLEGSLEEFVLPGQ